jgi:hypothetical protein
VEPGKGQHFQPLLVAAHEQQLLTQQVLGAERSIKDSKATAPSPYLPCIYPLPLLWLEATGWLAGCWASLGCTEGSGWLGAKKGTKECQGNTATERGSTFVHTVGKS